MNQMINKMRVILEMLPSRRLDPEYEPVRKEALCNAVRVGALLAGLLVPIFGVLDGLFKSEYYWEFFAIRMAVTVFSFFIYWLIKQPFGPKYSYQLGAVLTIVVASSISLMCRIDQGPADAYYAGINLPLLGFGILLPLTLLEGVIIFSISWLAYFIPNVLILESDQLTIFISNNFFILSTIVIGLAASQFHFYHRYRAWLSNHRLKAAHIKISSHAEELEVQVQERSQRLIQSERLAVVGQLAGGIAHDFNNILTAILGTCQLAMDTVDKKSMIYEDLNSIFHVGNRAVELVKQLLAFSRRQILQPKVVNLNVIIRDTEKMLRRLIGENIELMIDLHDELGPVLADPVQIEQIILNLAVNARDAMTEGGRLVIRTANVVLDEDYCRLGKLSLDTGTYAQMTVIDTGTGMSQNIKSKIFEPFFTTKEKGQGTGLGLASVYGIIKQSKGDVLVYSELGQGTSFKIYLPLTEVVDSAPVHKSELMQLPEGKETILLVEDEEAVRSLTARILKRQGYTVMQASEGRSALHMAEAYQGKIDMLLTDMIMPQMNGPALAKQMAIIRSETKILYMTGHVDSMIQRHGLDKDDINFLQKPFTLESLNLKIRGLFDN
ncbi:response regulator [bacterium]|nr:response regulator [bacterium]